MKANNLGEFVSVSVLLQLRSRLVVILCAVLVVLASASAAAEALSLDNVRMRLPLPGQTTAVLYFELSNRSGSDRQLVDVRVAGAERAEIHQHQHVDGMMRMRKVDAIWVKAGTQIEFKPHGYHVMVFKLLDTQESLPDEKIDQLYPVELKFEDGTTVSAQARTFRY